MITVLEKNIAYYVSVVKNRSFTKAAEELFVTQSAISQGIKALEESVGVELLERKRRSFTVTKAGRFFYLQCLSMMSEEKKIYDETKKLGGQEEITSFDIAYNSLFQRNELNEAVLEFSDLYPDVHFHVKSGAHEKVYDLLRNNQVDLGINDLRRVKSNEYHNIFLCEAYLYALFPKGMIDNEETADVSEFANKTCIIIAREDEHEMEETYYRNILGIRSPIIFAENEREAHMLLAGNCGYMIMEDTQTIPRIGSRMRTAQLQKDGEPLQISYYLFWRKEFSNEYKEKFAEILKQKMDDTL